MIKVLPAFSTLIVFTLCDPIIQLPNGKIRGRQGTTSHGTIYYGFERVPYAAPPIGELRFKAPQPPVTWDGIRDTIGRTISCYQQSDNGDFESEDCLFANIYTTVLPAPNGTTPNPLPIMFFMHGGGYVGGSSMWEEPENLLDHGVIVITINYRLGPFGFISTQDSVIPGNNGLKDQQRAIEWTYDNIHLFGGDPKMITIFGQSAGSSSVTFQLLNRKLEGKIRAGIGESGSFLSPWCFQRNAREIAFETAAILNDTFKSNRNSNDLLRFLQNVDAKDLDDASDQYQIVHQTPDNYELLQGFYWAPVVEAKNPDAFLTKKMYGLLKAGNIVGVPLLMGINSEEMLFNQGNRQELKATMEQYDANPDWLVPNDMMITDRDKKLLMGQAIKSLYTKSEPLANHLGDGVRYYSDTAFTRSVIKFAELASSFMPIYFYEFSYDGQLGGYNISYDGAEHVGHNEELSYLWGNGDHRNFPESDQVTQKRLLQIWTDFAKTQNPTPVPSELLQNVVWPLVNTTNGDFFYVDIGEDLVIKNHPKEETYEGWSKLYNSLSYYDFDTW